jgi:ribosomal protein S18 acetylase RimI-like enzyme
MTTAYELRRFGFGRHPNPVELSNLHARLLPKSPITRLGRHFREDFYYRDLPDLGHIFGTVAYVDNHAAGFAVAALDSDRFMRIAVRQKGLRIAWLLGRCLLASPGRIAAVWETTRIQAGREGLRSRARTGEVLSIGVLPQYRGTEFHSRTGLSIARDVLLDLMATFRESKARAVRTIVDEDNTPSIRLFERSGWRRVQTEVPGWRHPSIELMWNPGLDQ